MLRKPVKAPAVWAFGLCAPLPLPYLSYKELYPGKCYNPLLHYFIYILKEFGPSCLDVKRETVNIYVAVIILNHNISQIMPFNK